MEGYEQFREAARRGVRAAGAEPVMAEDFPSLSTSPRNACLDAVESADVYLGVVGPRGGWEAPSGKFVVEEEFEHAARIPIATLVLVQDCDRDDAAETLARKMSDYVRGGFRRTFRTPEELEQEVQNAVKPQIEVLNLPIMSQAVIGELLDSAISLANEATLRFVLAPEREEEVFDPIDLGSEEFFRDLMELGHKSSVGLLSHRYGKDGNLQGDILVVTQAPERHSRPPYQHVRVEVHSTGVLVIDSNVSGRIARGTQYGIGRLHQLVEEDLAAALQEGFAFAHAVYQNFDPYERHQRFGYNTAVTGIGHRRIVREFRDEGAFSMSMNAPARIVAYRKPRVIARQVLGSAPEEIARGIEMLKRRLNDS